MYRVRESIFLSKRTRLDPPPPFLARLRRRPSSIKRMSVLV